MSAIKREEYIGGQRLILGDCMEVMKELGRVDSVVTDPPYGIGITKSNRLAVSRGMGGKNWDDEIPDLAQIMEMKCKKIIWGGNYFPLPTYRAPLVWDKNNAGRDFADFELAWTNLDMVARRFVMRPMNMDGGKQHPTQKPVRLMEWCLGFLTDCTSVLDPFMGSGTTLVACQNLGFSGVGVERDPEYFDIACRRVEESTRQADMFTAQPETQKPEQQSLL